MSVLKSLVFLALVAVAIAESVHFTTCPEDVASCNIHEVRIDPCPQAASNRACNIRRRKPSKMSFDFTPNFDADTLEAALSWVKSQDQELPLVTMERDACKATSCPVKANQKQTYEIDIPIESKFPLNPYTIKWVLKAPTGQRCCFITDIKLVR